MTAHQDSTADFSALGTGASPSVPPVIPQGLPSNPPLSVPGPKPIPSSAPKRPLNAGLFTWAVILVALGVLLVIQAIFIKMGAGVFMTALLAVIGIALIVTAAFRRSRK